MAISAMANAIALAAILVCSGVQSAKTNTILDDWSSLPPYPDRHWAPCFQNYLRTRLEVPLDSGDPSRGTTAIAFLKLSATNVTSNTRSLLITPGRPGGTGIEAVLSQGPDLADIVQGQHSIIGFDPRGVGRSDPDFERLYYTKISNTSPTATGRQFAAAEIFGVACSPTVGGSSGSAAFVSTPAVTRDMLSFVEAEQKQILTENESENEQAKLWLGWRPNLYVAGKALDSFIKPCIQAGGNGICASRIDAFQYLKYNPIPIEASVTTYPLPMLATYSDLKQLILQTMYTSAEGFPNLAAILASLEEGNTTAYAAAATFQNIRQFEHYVDALTSQSEFFGEVWPNNANGFTCRAFEVLPPESGKLKGSILDTQHTASPILFVTTKIDPVAPQRGYCPQNVLRLQHSVGHTACASASSCLVQRIQSYLLSGQLPPSNSTCQADVEPF
ncbi:hypothetical protein BDW71DRAFT_195290 [Aspergillus fruticulosus]